MLFLHESMQSAPQQAVHLQPASVWQLQELQDARGRVRDMQQAAQDSRRQERGLQDAAEAAGQRERAALQRCELLAEERDQLNSQLDLDQRHALRREQQVSLDLLCHTDHHSCLLLFIKSQS